MATVRGQVKWFDDQKGYGFISQEGERRSGWRARERERSFSGPENGKNTQKTRGKPHLRPNFVSREKSTHRPPELITERDFFWFPSILAGMGFCFVLLRERFKFRA